MPALTRRAMKPSPCAGRSSLEASIGERLRARSAEKPTAEATATASSTKRRPMYPGMNISGAKTEISTMVVATTAKNTCRAPRWAATMGGSPSSTRLWMFSTTTMASSTTSPMASTRASRVRRLIENPNGARTMKVDRMQIGATTAGISAARQVPRKRKFTRATSTREMDMVIQTSWIAWRVKTV